MVLGLKITWYSIEEQFSLLPNEHRQYAAVKTENRFSELHIRDRSRLLKQAYRFRENIHRVNRKSRSRPIRLASSSFFDEAACFWTAVTFVHFCTSRLQTKNIENFHSVMRCGTYCRAWNNPMPREQSCAAFRQYQKEQLLSEPAFANVRGCFLHA